MSQPPRPRPWSDAIREGNAAERARFVESHLDLVRHVALRVAARLPAGIELDELVHEGILGLLDALEKFDPARGVLFRTYAEVRVRGAILDSLRERDWRPRSVRAMQRDLDQVVGMLSTINGRPPTEEEIAAAMGLGMKAYRQMLRSLRVGPFLSLQDLAPGADPAVVDERHLPDGRLERRELVEALARAIGELPERERRVLELYYHEGLNMREVGAVLGVTESRVCQLHSQAASRLRVGLHARLHATQQSAPRAHRAASRGGRR